MSVSSNSAQQGVGGPKGIHGKDGRVLDKVVFEGATGGRFYGGDGVEGASSIVRLTGHETFSPLQNFVKIEDGGFVPLLSGSYLIKLEFKYRSISDVTASIGIEIDGNFVKESHSYNTEKLFESTGVDDVRTATVTSLVEMSITSEGVNYLKMKCRNTDINDGVEILPWTLKMCIIRVTDTSIIQ